jgi:hypothetical protein
MRVVLTLVAMGLISAGCAPAGPRVLKLSDEPVTGDGLYLVEQRGPGRLVVSPELNKVRSQIRETSGAIVTCEVRLRFAASESVSPQKELEQRLCDAVKRNLVERPRPVTGPGSEAPSRIATEPGPGVMAVRVYLLDVELDSNGAPRRNSKPTFALRFNESVEGKPIMRYYEPHRVGGTDPIDAMVTSSFERLYGLYGRILESDTETPDVAAPPR